MSTIAFSSVSHSSNSTSTHSTSTHSISTYPENAHSTNIHSYPTQLQQLIHRLQQTPYLTPLQTKEAVEQANLSATDLMRWASFDRPVTDSYGRKLVFDGGHFEIMVMSWLPGDFSAIHDHGATQWGAVQCFGVAEHLVYHLSDGYLSGPISAPYTPRMVRAVDRDLIHQMGNSGNHPFLSLHVYGCADGSKRITGNARVFDLLESSVQHTDGGVFFNLPEELINYRRYGLRANLETTLIHHCLMRDRVRRVLEDDDSLAQLEVSQIQRLKRKLTLLDAAIYRLSNYRLSNYRLSSLAIARRPIASRFL